MMKAVKKKTHLVVRRMTVFFISQVPVVRKGNISVGVLILTQHQSAFHQVNATVSTVIPFGVLLLYLGRATEENNAFLFWFYNDWLLCAVNQILTFLRKVMAPWKAK